MTDINEIVSKLGHDKAYEILLQYLAEETEKKNNILTIVVNRGVHHLPTKFLRGSIYYASEGNLDFSTSESVQTEFINILERVAKKLKSQKWKEIYIVPFGPSALCMQIKLLVYRITKIESADLFYMGRGEYIDLEIDQRSVIVSVE